MDISALTPKELRRYERHFMLPGFGKEGQAKLKNASVLVVGAGGLGCSVLQYLAAAGIGRIGIADNDFVSEDNLQRQVLYGDKDLGKLKAIIARERLQHQNPIPEYQVHNIYLKPDNALNLIREYDILVDATDNFPTRYLLNDACIILNKSWVFGSIYKYEGQLSVFNYRGGPSLRCIFPNPPGPEEAPSPRNIGVLGVLPGIIGTMMANETVKMISENGECLSGKMLIMNIQDYSLQSFSFRKNPENFGLDSLQDDYSVS